MTGMKLRERVKNGELNPKEAIILLSDDPSPNLSIISWLENTGPRRYQEALAAKARAKDKAKSEKLDKKEESNKDEKPKKKKKKLRKKDRKKEKK